MTPISGKFREYNWNDIKQLIFNDVGLTTDEQQRLKGKFYIYNNMQEPKDELTTCVRVDIYDKPYRERLEDQCGEKIE